MLGRALSLAAVTLLIGCFATIPAQAQNLEAGKSPSQIFAGTCSACHRSPRGLLRSVPAGSLPGFLRQHYTTSGEMASLLSAFLISNGATDTRYVGSQPKAGKDAKPETRPGGPPEQLDRYGRRLRPAAPIQEDAAKPAADGQTPAQAASERGPDGRKSAAKQKLGKRGKPGTEEPARGDAPKSDTARDEPAKGEPAQDDTSRSEAAKNEGNKPEVASPAGDTNSEAGKVDAAKETGNEAAPLRADPVPPVTPAPASAAASSATVSNDTPEAAAAPSMPARSSEPVAESSPPTVTVSAPPPAPVAPAGPPQPPISQ